MEKVPEIQQFREVVDHIIDARDRYIVQFLYLCCARVSEVTTRTCPSDGSNTKSLGMYLDWSLATFEKDKDVFLVRVPVLKRRVQSKKHGSGVFVKQIALPIYHESWCLDLLKYLRKHGKLSLDLTRQRIYQIVRENLRAFFPMIHPHSLRHYRITHLADDYGFDAQDLTIYAGWTYKTMYGRGAGQLDTYLHSGWKRYFPKLLKPIENL